MGIGLISAIILVARFVFVELLDNSISESLFMHILMTIRGRTLVLIIIAFLVFYQITKGNIYINSFINKISSSIFGVYLVHENYLARQYIWEGIFNINNMITSVWYPIYYIFIVLITFVICIFFEIIREKIFEKCIYKMLLIDKISNKIDDFINF